MKHKIAYKSFHKNGELLHESYKEIVFENGIKMLEISKVFDNIETLRSEYFYENGLLVKIEDFDVNGEFESIKTFTYNAAGKLIHEIWQYVGSDQIEYEMKLIEAENKIIETEPFGVVTKLLDNKGRVIEEIESEDYYIKHHYEGDLLMRTQIFMEGKLSVEDFYNYDDKGNEIGSKGFEYREGLEDESETVLKLKYTTFGEISSEEHFRNGVLISKTTFEFDDKERLIEVRVESIPSGEVQITKHSYEE